MNTNEQTEIMPPGRSHLVERDGFIYFIADGADAIKIGFSGAPNIRLADLQAGSSRPLRLIAVTPGTEPQEQALHKRFAHLRIHREWFRAGGDLVAYIEKIKNPKPAAELVAVDPMFLRECRRLVRFIERSHIPPWKQAIADRARLAAMAVDQPAFTQNATFQRACLDDIAAFSAA